MGRVGGVDGYVGEGRGHSLDVTYANTQQMRTGGGNLNALQRLKTTQIVYFHHITQKRYNKRVHYTGADGLGGPLEALL
jgi:hypothetical protein